MLNKDFLKEIFINEKKLLRLNEVKRICVPLYDELSVIKLWPMLQRDIEFMKFFPEKMAKGRVPDREYFFNILNTLHSDYVSQLVKHAQQQRNSGAIEVKAKETIEISDDWWNILNSIPFVSCKSKLLQ